MEQIGNHPRKIIVKEVVQVTHIVLVCEEGADEETDDLIEPVCKEYIVASNRRPIPIPYTEEP